MNFVTVDFVERLLLYKTQALKAKGSVYISPAIRELLEYRSILIGMEILDGVTYRLKLDEKIEMAQNAMEKLRVLAAMDGGMDQPAGSEAIEIVEELLRHG